MNVIMLGPPGAGKGTQAAMLAERLGIPHVASGDLFREALQSKTELGLKAKSYMDRGELVPDEVTIAMIRERLLETDCDEGVILDGFPRTIEQAKALKELLAEQGKVVDVALFIDASEEELVRRLSSRWTCRNCQAVYNVISNPPREKGECDVCGGELYQRDDDVPETVRNRIRVYRDQTSPLIDYYQGEELLTTIESKGGIERVHQRIVEALKIP
ncbi:MAG: adenylate kinase [Anaerolineae bacterium]|nr:adenylate kinase [Anaerolineae bacterium]NIN97892.1 adenylate kinase [Anaerolineae bacterium]NIQ80871.1 adenylate kinase [Anaerolineae bacterium]